MEIKTIKLRIVRQSELSKKVETLLKTLVHAEIKTKFQTILIQTQALIVNNHKIKIKQLKNVKI